MTMLTPAARHQGMSEVAQALRAAVSPQSAVRAHW
jgi:hypothetical protein